LTGEEAMLFIMKTTDANRLDVVDILAGDDDKELLLISDAVYLARNPVWEKLAGMKFDAVYAEKKAAEDRGLEIAGGCTVVDMPEVVELFVEHCKVVNL
jgi:sulfur relay protein TusB/DsrH